MTRDIVTSFLNRYQNTNDKSQVFLPGFKITELETSLAQPDDGYFIITGRQLVFSRSSKFISANLFKLADLQLYPYAV